jgi:hypothetical protein
LSIGSFCSSETLLYFRIRQTADSRQQKQ